MPAPRPPDDVYAPPRAARSEAAGGWAWAHDAPPKAYSDVPDGDLDAALAGALPLRARAAMAEGWAAVRGAKGAFLLLSLLCAPMLALPHALRLLGGLVANGLGVEAVLDQPEAWPWLIDAAPRGVQRAAALLTHMVWAVYAQLTWALALRIIGGGPARLWGLLDLRAAAALAVAQLIVGLPALLMPIALEPAAKFDMLMIGPALTTALSALSWGLMLWAAPLLIDRKMRVWQAIPRAAWLAMMGPGPVLAFGVAALAVYALAGLSCWLGLMWAQPFVCLTLAAAWRQLAGLRRTPMQVQPTPPT